MEPEWGMVGFFQNVKYSTGRRPLERPKPTWDDCIRIDLKEMGFSMRSWVDTAEDRDWVLAYAHWTMISNIVKLIKCKRLK